MQSGQSIPHLNTASVFDGRTASTGLDSRRSASSMPIQSNTRRWRKPAAMSTGLRGTESDSTVADTDCNLASKCAHAAPDSRLPAAASPALAASRNDDGIHAGLTNPDTMSPPNDSQEHGLA